MTSFEQNVQLYERELPRLLEKDEGKCLLIRQAAIVDLFDSADAALTAGYSRFGAGEFLIKEVLRRDLVIIQATSANGSTGACMLESTNALIGGLIAVMREIRRMEVALSEGPRTKSDAANWEALGEQLHAAYAELAEAYEARQATIPSLLPLDALRGQISAEAVSPGQ